MFVQIVMMCAVLTTVRGIPQKPCDRIQVNDSWYEKDTVLSNIGRPYNLIVHKSTNTLFFSYSLTDTYTDIDFQLAYVDLNTGENEVIAGIRGGCTIAIDQGNDIIYLGGSDGIYKYNIMTRLADNYKEKGKNIWALYFRTNLFYISYPDQKLYIDVDGRFIKVSEFENFEVDSFHVTPNNDIYFANKSGLYYFNSAKFMIEIVNELINVRQIVEDNDGILYVCTNFGILMKCEGEFKKVLDQKGIYGLAFDKDNSFILSDEKNIIKLRRSDKGCASDDFSW